MEERLKHGKDYWHICSRNFKFLFYVAVLGVIISLFLAITKEGDVASILPVAGVAVTCIILADLFKKHNKWAIWIAYILVGGSFARNFLDHDIVPALIGLYFLYYIVKASRQKFARAI